METSNKVVEVINAICEKFGVAIDWTSENVLPYVEGLLGRLVKFELWESVFWICFIPMLALGMFFMARYFTKKADESDWDCDDFFSIASLVSWVIFAALALASIIIIGVQGLDIIKCLTCPEKVIFDYITAQL